MAESGRILRIKFPIGLFLIFFSVLIVLIAWLRVGLRGGKGSGA